jgi:hypothetical protein
MGILTRWSLLRIRGSLSSAIMSAALSIPLVALSGPSPAIKSPDFSIPFVDHGGILDWQADGSKGIWIQASGGRWYYASFSSPCADLPLSTGIRFVPEPTGDLSRWSSIRLSDSERCFFRTLQPSNGPPNNVKQTKPSGSPSASDKSARGANSQATQSSRLVSRIVLDLTAPRIEDLFPLAQVRALLHLEPDATSLGSVANRIPNEQLEDDRPDVQVMPAIVVRGGADEQVSLGTNGTPCGLVGIVWSMVHPADAWRIVTPVPSDSDVDQCARAASVGVAI